MTTWTSKDAPRIWRAWRNLGDDPLNGEKIYTDEVLAGIAGQGFTGIWLFCLLYDLMDSSVFPELNREKANERIASLQTLIERAKKHGIGVYLYFNEPVGVPAEHPFWEKHADLKGEPKWGRFALCTSTPEVQSFLSDALESVFSRLRDVAGVFLITGSEDITHCWSKITNRDSDDRPNCPRCRERMPAELVTEHFQAWADVRSKLGQEFRILAWNWSWNYWKEDQLPAILNNLPADVDLLLDMEFGGERMWKDRLIEVGEYSLGYVGPCRAFVQAQEAVAGKDRNIYAKLELNNTHELCSVPNLPVLRTIHAKFRALEQREASGFMGCWTMGARFTLNTYALKLFLTAPERFRDGDVFLDALAREYFGFTRTEGAVQAWDLFSDAMKWYPFSVPMLYRGPQNDAPARVLSLDYRGVPLFPSYVHNEDIGDDLSSCLDIFTLDEVCEGFSELSECWSRGLAHYEQAFEANASAAIDDLQRQHQREELGCARMLDIQFRSIKNAFHFFREQQRLMERDGLTAPCRVPEEAELLRIMEEEARNAEKALPLIAADERLGFHQDYQNYKYDAGIVEKKIARMREELAGCSR